MTPEQATTAEILFKRIVPIYRDAMLAAPQGTPLKDLQGVLTLALAGALADAHACAVLRKLTPAEHREFTATLVKAAYKWLKKHPPAGLN